MVEYRNLTSFFKILGNINELNGDTSARINIRTFSNFSKEQQALNKKIKLYAENINLPLTDTDKLIDKVKEFNVSRKLDTGIIFNYSDSKVKSLGDEHITKVNNVFIDLDMTNYIEDLTVRENLVTDFETFLHREGLSYWYKATGRGGGHYLLAVNLEADQEQTDKLKQFINVVRKKFNHVHKDVFDTKVLNPGTVFRLPDTYNYKELYKDGIKKKEYPINTCVELNDQHLEDDIKTNTKYFESIKIKQIELPTIDMQPESNTIESNQLTSKPKTDNNFFNDMFTTQSDWNFYKQEFNIATQRDPIFLKNVGFYLKHNPQDIPAAKEFINYIKDKSSRWQQVESFIKSSSMNTDDGLNTQLKSNLAELFKWSKDNKLDFFKGKILYYLKSNDNDFAFERTSFQSLVDLKDCRKPFIKDMFMSESLIMIFSPPKTMKSFFSVYSACCIATGTPMLNQKTKEANVMYVDFENGKYTLKERFEGFLKGENFDKNKIEENLHLFSFPTSFFEVQAYGELRLKEQAKTKIFNYVKDNNIEVIYIDTLRRLGNFEENDSKAINCIYNELYAPLMKEFGCCIIFLHHTPKDSPNTYRGSGDILGMVTTAYLIKQNEPKQILTIEKFESRDNPIPSLQLNYEIDPKTVIDDDGDEKEVIDTIKFSRTETQVDNNDSELYTDARAILIDKLELQKQYKNNELKSLLVSETGASGKTVNEIIKWAFSKNILLDNNENKGSKLRRYYINPQHKPKTVDVEHEASNEEHTLNTIKQYLHDKFKTLDQIELNLLKKTEQFNSGLFDEKYLSLVIADWLRKGWLNPAKSGYLNVTELYRSEN